MSTPSILVLYCSKYGTTQQMAKAIAEGVVAGGCSPVVRTVPNLTTSVSVVEPAIPLEGDIYCTTDDLIHCAGLALGSPTRFGNMAAEMKYFWDQTATVWLAGQLQGKPACVFTASGSMHGGQETTLLTMMIPLLHHGMLLMGLPYSLPELSSTQRGGTPYGPSHVSGTKHDQTMSQDERSLCIAQGKRLAQTVLQLNK